MTFGYIKIDDPIDVIEDDETGAIIIKPILNLPKGVYDTDEQDFVSYTEILYSDLVSELRVAHRDVDNEPAHCIVLFIQK